MLVGILDASATIGLAHGGVFEQLSSLYASLYVPPAVREEIVEQGRGRAGEQELRRALGVWIDEAMPDPLTLQRFPSRLSTADQEVLALALERAADHILTSDEDLIRVAAQSQLTCLRATDVVVLMKRAGLVADVRPVLDRMRFGGFGIHDALYESALQAAGEWPTL
jgi:predicted nucleic acid-binding protein